MKLMTWKFMEQKVFVYRNLQQKCWSVRSRTGANYGRVIFHASSINLAGAHFSVNAKQRLRVIEERQKNVHAGVVGYLAQAIITTERYPQDQAVSTRKVATAEYDEKYWGEGELTREVTYNPYQFESFVYMDDKSPVDGKGMVVTLAPDMTVWAEDIRAAAKAVA